MSPVINRYASRFVSRAVRPCIVTLLALVGALSPGTIFAQPVPLRDACPACRLRLTEVVSLGDERDGYIGEVDDIVRDGRGNYVLATRARRGELVVFSADGAFLRTIGRPGAGPGEYAFAARLFRTGVDTLHVIDIQQHRWTVLAPDRSVLRTAPYQGSFNFAGAFLSDGHAVLNLYVGSPDAAGMPLHLSDPRGRIVRSFGGEGRAPVRYDVPSTHVRRVAIASDTTLWAAPMNEYRLVLWHVSGQRLVELARQPPPFEPWVQVRRPTPTVPPQPLVKAIRADASGLLWVLYHVPAAGWRGTLRETRGERGTTFYVTDDQDALFDTVVEVIDPERQVVLVSQRVDACLQGFVDDGLVYSFSAANVQAKVWQLELVRP